MNTILLITSTVFAGLMAGLFYAWSISVTPGLANVSDENYLHAFQSMNRAILNPLFFIAFMGQAILLPLLSFLYFKSSAPGQFMYILSATILYLAGCMAFTIFGNVPLNETLEALKIGNLSPNEMDAFRKGFENKWNNLNWIRTASTLLSLLLLIIACLKNLAK
jgi:uncharacterized membrane protein